ADLPGTGGWEYGSVTFPNGQSWVNIPVEVTGSYDDGTVEGDETVEIYLQSAMSGEYTLGSPSSDTLTIIDDDQAAEVWIETVVDAEEGVSDGYFRLERDVTAGALTVD